MTVKEQKRLDWAARIAEFRASGLTMAAWCAANQCSLDQLKYWLYKSKKLASSTDSTPSARFVPLTVFNETDAPYPASSLVVRVGQASIELRAGFDPKLLRDVIQALEVPC